MLGGFETAELKLWPAIFPMLTSLECDNGLEMYLAKSPNCLGA